MEQQHSESVQPNPIDQAAAAALSPEEKLARLKEDLNKIYKVPQESSSSSSSTSQAEGSPQKSSTGDLPFDLFALGKDEPTGKDDLNKGGTSSSGGEWTFGAFTEEPPKEVDEEKKKKSAVDLSGINL